MELLINVINQKLKLATNLKSLVAGTQQFIKLIFNLPDEWDGLLTFAQFIQGSNSYNSYLDENNSVYLPSEIQAGTCKVLLYGTGNQGENSQIIATTNCLEFTIDENIIISDASSTDISQSLYDQLVQRVNNIIAHNNDTEGNSELIDIRTGADGTLFSTAGSAVRGQFSNANHQIDKLNSLSENFLALGVVPWAIRKHGYFRYDTGEFYNVTRYETGYATLYGASGQRFLYRGRGIGNIASVLYYDSNDNYLGGERYNENYYREITVPTTIDNKNVNKVIFASSYDTSNTSYLTFEIYKFTNIIGNLYDRDSNLQSELNTEKTELIDIRTGADGTVYASAGAAVRKQLGGIIERQDAAFNSIPILWKNGKSLDRATEVDQANRCISDYIEISGRNIEVIVPNDHSVKYSFLFFDSEKQYVRGTNYANESGTFNSYLNGSYCKYFRIRAGMSDDSVPAEYPQLTDSFSVRWADSDVMKFRGNILAEGYTSFTQCTQNGYYSFTQADLQGISDAGDFNKGGILMVERNAAARVVFQTILLTDGTQYFRYGSNSFRKCIPDAAELPNSFAYRGEVSNYSVTALSQLTEDGYYDVKWSDRNNLSDYPANLNTSGYLVVYSNTATGRISQELHAISGIIYFRYDNNPFVRIYNPDACEQYRENIQSLGYTAIRSCTQPGYYSCTQDYLENLTDKPTDLSTGFIVEVHNNASGGVTYQTITDNNGVQWFRYGDRPFVKRGSNGYEKPAWYAIGDSITQGFYSYMNGDTPAISTTTNCWAKIAADKAGFALTNYGVGGSGFVHNATVGDRLNARDHIDTIDFSGADMVTIAYGINDWKGSNTFGSFNDDITTGGTVYSNMRYVIEKILTDNPECKVFIITPINASKYGNQSGNWSLSHTINGKTLEDMFQLEKTVADYYGIELIDMTHNSVFNRINCPALLIDGVHPTLKGHQLMGAELAKKINFQ